MCLFMSQGSLGDRGQRLHSAHPFHLSIPGTCRGLPFEISTQMVFQRQGLISSPNYPQITLLSSPTLLPCYTICFVDHLTTVSRLLLNQEILALKEKIAIVPLSSNHTKGFAPVFFLTPKKSGNRRPIITIQPLYAYGQPKYIRTLGTATSLVMVDHFMRPEGC